MADGGFIDVLGQYAISAGTLPAGWSSPDNTWTIVGKMVSNAPLTTELLTDGGLEGTYTGGLCDALTAVGGSMAFDQSADVHGGSKAQQMHATANWKYVYYPFTDAANRWYAFSGWAKLTAAAVGSTVWIAQLGTINPVREQITATSYTKMLSYSNLSVGSGSLYIGINGGGSGVWDTVIFDDLSIKRLTLADLFLTYDFGYSTNITADIPVSMSEGASDPSGAVICLNSRTSPTDFYIATVEQNVAGNSYIVLVRKCVSGVYTTIISSPNITKIDGQNVKIVKSGNVGGTITAYYNGAQMSTPYTIQAGDPTTGTLHGLFAAGGSSSLNLTDASFTGS